MHINALKSLLLGLGSLSLIASLPGCGIVIVRSAGAGAGASGASTYAGPECSNNHIDGDQVSREAAVLNRVCARRAKHHIGQPRSASMGVQERHKRFDDRHPDHVVAALNVIDCAQRCDRDPLAMGISVYYAGLLQESVLADQLQQLQLPDDARSAFQSLAMASRSQVSAAAQGLDPRRKHMYIDVVEEVVAARKGYVEGHAGLYAKLDALEGRAASARGAGKAPEDLVKGMNELRGEYFSSCKSDACRFDPFVVEVTRELVLLHIAAGDALLARGENGLLAEKAAGRHLFSVETGTAVYRAMTEERHQWELYSKAKESGLDAQTMAARFGSPPPVNVDPSSDYIGSENLPDLTQVLGTLEGASALSYSAGIIAQVADAHRTSTHGEPLAQVSFKPNITREDITSCFETGRVTGAHFDGNHAELEYESICNVVGTKTNVEKVPPVLVPRAEIAGAQPGENLESLVAASREGVVVRSLAKGTSGSTTATRVLQVRGHRLPGK